MFSVEAVHREEQAVGSMLHTGLKVAEIAVWKRKELHNAVP